MQGVQESYGTVYRVIKEARFSGYIATGLRGRMSAPVPRS